MRWMGAVLLGVALGPAPLAAAASLVELEQAARRAAQERERLEAERGSLDERAHALATGIERLKRESGGARAGPELERSLRAFDELAGRLDGVEARLAARERELASARAAFEAAADEEDRRLATLAAAGDRAAGERFLDLSAARARLAALGGEPARPRPPLDVQAEPRDGPAELQAKLALVAAERRRLESEIERLGRDQRVLEARLEAKRALERELLSARRQAAGRLPLVDRAAHEARRAVAALAARAAATRSARDELRRALRSLDDRRQDLDRRLERLRAPGAPAHEVP